jgi:hypothetical protein
MAGGPAVFYLLQQGIRKQPVADHVPVGTKRHASVKGASWRLRVMLFVIFLILPGAGPSCAPNEDSADANGRQRPASGNRQLQAQANQKNADLQVVNQDSNKSHDDELITKAQTRGRLRVMVQLNYDGWRPEGELPDDRAVEQQRLRIIQLQDKILEQLAEFDVRSVKKFKYAPQMAMEVDAVALRQLINSPDVAGISEDALAGPTF